MQNRLPVGYSVRRPTMDDLKPVTEMLQISELADIGRVITSEYELRTRWETPGYDISRDAWLTIAPEGQIVAMISVRHFNNSRMYGSARVHPDHVGLGLYAHLLDLAAERARELAQEVPEGTRVTFNVFCPEKVVEPRPVLEQAGFTHVRSDWTMQIDMDQPPPTPRWPESIELRPYTPDLLHAIFEAQDEAFQDHWGHLSVSFELWQTWMVKREEFNPGLWFLACKGNEIAGVALCEYEQGVGWVGDLGVRRPWRRKGLALALLHHAFGEFYRRDERKVLLNVDSQNLTGATRLYVRAGMRPVQQTDIYELELRAGVELSTQTLEG
jgi:mycothiol synthase